MPELPIDKMMAINNARFDQAKMAGVEWIIKSNHARLADFTKRMMDGPDSLRAMTDGELGIIENLARIGLYEITTIYMTKIEEMKAKAADPQDGADDSDD